MYTVDIKSAQTILGYKELFGEEKLNLVEEIKKLNVHKAISIISELIQVRDVTCNPVCVGGMEIKLPFDIVLKREFGGMKPSSAKEMFEMENLHKDKHIVSLQMLLILLKKILIYGNMETIDCDEYDITHDDYQEIIKLQLLVADIVAEKNKKEFNVGHFIYSNYHLNYQRNVASEFLRMYYMMEKVSRDVENFDEDVKGEYRDYYSAFYNKYGITPTEYSSFLFGELQPYYEGKNALAYKGLWRNAAEYYKSTKNVAKIQKALDILQIKPGEYREWALNTEETEWDFSAFFENPLICDGKGKHISISDITLRNAFFEKMFWLIRDCYPIEDSRSMAFFGRLYEKYIQELTEKAANDIYKFIPEFEFKIGREKKKSSDAYIRKDKKLLAVEAKGFSVLIDCMIKNEKVEDNNKKLFVKPILQADKCIVNTISDRPEFDEVDEIFIVSVTMDNVNAVPNYYNSIHQEIEQNKQSGLVKYYFNLNIEEYEMLMYLIENKKDVFELLRNYFGNTMLKPFSNYLKECYPEVVMTRFMSDCYNEASRIMKKLLWD